MRDGADGYESVEGLSYKKKGCTVVQPNTHDSHLVVKEPEPGGDGGGGTPVPMPNTKVKPSSAEGTGTAWSWESRTLPGGNGFATLRTEALHRDRMSANQGSSCLLFCWFKKECRQTVSKRCRERIDFT